LPSSALARQLRERVFHRCFFAVAEIISYETLAAKVHVRVLLDLDPRRFP
jgi:hypothetical protein